MEPIDHNHEQETENLYQAFHLIEAEKMKSRLSSHGIHRNTKVIKHNFVRDSKSWWMAAAVLLVVVSSYFVFVTSNTPDPQKLADNSLATIAVDYNFSIRSVDTIGQLSKAQSAMNIGQFTLADQHLDTALTFTSPLDSSAIANIYFYKGLIALSIPNYKKAIQTLSLVTTYNSSILRKDAIWLRGLAYIKVENFEAAKKDFQYIQKSKGWKKAKEASKILESLDNK